jgi:hypothetical protein
MALRFVRARHVPPSGDLGRMRRQQHFIDRTLAAAVGTGTGTGTGAGTGADGKPSGARLGPEHLAGAIRGLFGSIRTDPDLRAEQLIDLAGALRAAPGGVRTEFATVPIADFNHWVPGWGSTLLWDADRAGALFTALRSDRSITGLWPRPETVPVAIDPRTVTAGLRDASGQPGSAARATVWLRASGFRTTDGRLGGHVPDTTVPKTVISYAPTRDRAARALHAALPGSVLRVDYGRDDAVDVLLGRNFSEIRRVHHDWYEAEGGPVTGKEINCP